MKKKLLSLPIMFILLAFLGIGSITAFAAQKTIAVASIKISISSISMTRGATFPLSVKINPSNATNKKIKWSSSNTAVAAVSSSGIVTAYHAGSCTITATASNNKRAICSIKVNAPPTHILSISSVSVNTVAGTAPNLPSVVTAQMSDGTTKSIGVTWSYISPSQYASGGTFTVNGTVAGSNVSAIATITVKASQSVTISGIDIANEDYNGNVLSDPADATFDKDSLRYIAISFKLTHSDGKSDNVFVKIYDPSGHLETYSDGSSPSGYTDEATNNRIGFGNSTKSIFDAGIYKVEFWYGGKLMTTKTFTVKASQSVTISGIDIANEDYNGNVLSDPADATFDEGSLRYIAINFKLTHSDGKSDNVFVKIYDPSGHLETYSDGSSPSGYTDEATNNRIGFGNSTKSIFDAGIYKVEFWYGGKLVTTKTFTVKASQLVTISGIDIANEDYNGNVLSDPADATFDKDSLRYIAISFKLTHSDGKSDNIFVKIYDPSGHLETYSDGSSPSGYTDEATNNRIGFGNSTKSVFDAGIYKVEFWYGGKLVTTKTFTVVASSAGDHTVNTVGNIGGNVVNGGEAACQGDWILFQ